MQSFKDAKFQRLILIIIFFLAFFLRVYKLGSFPVGFLWDEASLGYNAYSILKTGKDEYGNFLPIIFKSFGDYKPGLYVYLTIPSVLIFGLSEFAVRFPSALFGSLSVLIFYFLIKESLGKGSDKIPLISALLLAISPWHLIFSRGSWELNVMLFELLLGIYLLTKFLNNPKRIYLILSGFVFLLTLITYQSAKFLLPVLLVGFFLFFREKIFRKNKKDITFFTALIFIVFVVFNLWTALGGKGGRVKVMSVFSYPRSPEEKEMFLSQDKNTSTYSLFHGTPIFFVRSVLGRYFHHFSGKFLFIMGDWSNQRNGVVYQGVMYYLDTVFLLTGLAVLFGRKRTSFDNFMLFWLIIAPLPAALTRDDISSVRSFTMVIPLIYISTIGINTLLDFFTKRKIVVKSILYSIFIILYSLLFVRFLDLYFIHDPKYTSENRLYGYKRAMEYIKPLFGQKNKIIFTDKYGQPYIFCLFYTKYDPAKYQKQALLKENPYGDVGKVEKIDNLEFREIYWPNDRSFNNSLFVGDEFDLPISDVVGQNNITLLEEIKFLNDKTAFRIVETN